MVMTWKRTALCVMVTLSCLNGAPSLASSSTTGTIAGISVEQGRVFFYTSGTRTSTPACHIIPGRWVFSASTADGQAMLSFLMTMYATGKQIDVMGTGTCPDWPDTESVRYIHVL